MKKSDKLNVREGTVGKQGAGASNASCYGSLKASNSSPLVSPTATINMPRGLYNVDVSATFGVLLTIVGDMDVLKKDIEAGKHEELLSDMTNDNHNAVMDALVAMCDSIQAENTNADAIPCKVSHVDDSTIVDALMAENLNVDESPIVQSVSIHDKPSSYIAAARGSRLKPSATRGSKLEPSISKVNFRSLFSEICVKVLISSFQGRLWKRLVPDLLILCMVISLDPPRCGLCKIFGHVRDYCPKKVSIPITVVSPNVPTPTVEMTNNGYQTVGKKKKKSKTNSTNDGQIGGHSVKQNVRYESKGTTSALKKGATNLGNASKSSSMKN
uniref:Zinc knuckle CX2CX4HX4C n=1 Tax=Tanacetum cinerariifolium TaxID=118510 RepID=A0A6L2NSE0_TANCI|nr:zinc knuckle CX2CX4HX4C [Tanacetum cinerariifolium]